jgi:tetratricopeptide (TPR) repeat protein
VALAEAESLRSQLGWREDPEEGMRRAEQLAQQALRIDDPGSNARAHALLGRANAFFARFPEALAEADRAIGLNASDAVAYALRAEVLLYLGRIDESIAAGETARRFDPRMGSDSGFVLAMAYYSAGRLRESIATADSFIPRYPDNPFLHAVRAAALAQEGRLDEARLSADQVRRSSPFFQVEVFGTRFVRAEDRKRAQEGLRKAGL